MFKRLYLVLLLATFTTDLSADHEKLDKHSMSELTRLFEKKKGEFSIAAKKIYDGYSPNPLLITRHIRFSEKTDKISIPCLRAVKETNEDLYSSLCKYLSRILSSDFNGWRNYRQVAGYLIKTIDQIDSLEIVQNMEDNVEIREFLRDVRDYVRFFCNLSDSTLDEWIRSAQEYRRNNESWWPTIRNWGLMAGGVAFTYLFYKYVWSNDGNAPTRDLQKKAVVAYNAAVAAQTQQATAVEILALTAGGGAVVAGGVGNYPDGVNGLTPDAAANRIARAFRAARNRGAFQSEGAQEIRDRVAAEHYRDYMRGDHNVPLVPGYKPPVRQLYPIKPRIPHLHVESGWKDFKRDAAAVTAAGTEMFNAHLGNALEMGDPAKNLLNVGIAGANMMLSWQGYGRGTQSFMASFGFPALAAGLDLVANKEFRQAVEAQFGGDSTPLMAAMATLFAVGKNGWRIILPSAVRESTSIPGYRMQFGPLTLGGAFSFFQWINHMSGGKISTPLSMAMTVFSPEEMVYLASTIHWPVFKFYNNWGVLMPGYVSYVTHNFKKYLAEKSAMVSKMIVNFNPEAYVRNALQAWETLGIIKPGAMTEEYKETVVEQAAERLKSLEVKADKSNIYYHMVFRHLWDIVSDPSERLYTWIWDNPEALEKREGVQYRVKSEDSANFTTKDLVTIMEDNGFQCKVPVLNVGYREILLKELNSY